MAEEQCVTWGDDPRSRRDNFGGNIYPTSLIPQLRIGLVHAAAQDRSRRLIANVEGCGAIAQRGRSLISTIASLFLFFSNQNISIIPTHINANIYR